MGNTSLRDLLWYVSVALNGLLAARVVQLRLARRYPVLVTLLCFNVARNGLLVYLRSSGRSLFNHNGYNAFFIFTEPIVWALYLLLLVELYSLMLEAFPGLRRLGRLVMVAAVVSLGVASAVLILLDQHAGFDAWPFLSKLALKQRTVYLGLSALTVFLLLFVAHYRLPICRNVWVLWSCFSGIFLAAALLFTLRRYLGSGFIPTRDVLGPLSYVAALLSANLFLSEAGESEKRPISLIGARRNPELEAALSSQLQSFNQVLLKVLRQ